MESIAKTLSEAHIGALVKQCKVRTGTDKGDAFLQAAQEAGLLLVQEGSNLVPVWEEEVDGWNGAVARRWALKSGIGPAPLAVRYDFAGDLFSRACDLWYSLASLPDSIPAIARDAIASEAQTAGATAMAFALDLGINADGYGVSRDDEDRAKLYYDLAQRAWTVAGALEYRATSFAQIKLPK